MTADHKKPIDHVKSLAKSLHADVRACDAKACERVRLVDKAAAKQTDEELAGTFGLMRAQFVVAREHGFEDWRELKKASELELRFAITLARIPDLCDEGIVVGLKPARARASRKRLRSKLRDVDAALAYFRQNAAVDADGSVTDEMGEGWTAPTSADWMARINKTFHTEVTPGVVIAAALIYGAAHTTTGSPHVQFDMVEFRALPRYGIQEFAENVDELVRRIHYYGMEHVLGFVVPGLNWAILRWVFRDQSLDRLARLEHVVPRPTGPVTSPLSDEANRILLDDEINSVFAYASRQRSYEEVDLIRSIEAQTEAFGPPMTTEEWEAIMTSYDDEDGEESDEDEVAALETIEQEQVPEFDLFTAEKEELTRAFAHWSSVPDAPRLADQEPAPPPPVVRRQRDLAEERALNESSFFGILDEMLMGLRTSTRHSPRTAPALRALADDLARIMASDPRVSPVYGREGDAMKMLEAFAARLDAGEAERLIAPDFQAFVTELQAGMLPPGRPPANELRAVLN